MRIIVLGAKGQLGTELMKVLDQEGFEPIAIGRDQLDVSSASVSAQLENLPEASIVINCIAYVRVDDAEDNRDLAMLVNSAFPAQLAKYCARTGSLLVHISTDYVFSGLKGAAYESQDVPDPINVYGESKAAGEVGVRENLERHLILRVSAIYGRAGSSGKGGNFVETMLRLAQEGRQLRVVNDQTTSPTYCPDIAMTLATVLKQAQVEYGTYHCANSGHCSWFDFANEIFRQSSINADLIPVSSDEFTQKAQRPRFSALASSKSMILPSWQDGLKRYLTERAASLREKT